MPFDEKLLLTPSWKWCEKNLPKFLAQGPVGVPELEPWYCNSMGALYPSDDEAFFVDVYWKQRKKFRKAEEKTVLWGPELFEWMSYFDVDDPISMASFVGARDILSDPAQTPLQGLWYVLNWKLGPGYGDVMIREKTLPNTKQVSGFLVDPLRRYVTASTKQDELDAIKAWIADVKVMHKVPETKSCAQACDALWQRGYMCAGVRRKPATRKEGRTLVLDTPVAVYVGGDVEPGRREVKLVKFSTQPPIFEPYAPPITLAMAKQLVKRHGPLMAGDIFHQMLRPNLYDSWLLFSRTGQKELAKLFKEWISLRRATGLFLTRKS